MHSGEDALMLIWWWMYAPHWTFCSLAWTCWTLYANGGCLTVNSIRWSNWSSLNCLIHFYKYKVTILVISVLTGVLEGGELLPDKVWGVPGVGDGDVAGDDHLGSEGVPGQHRGHRHLQQPRVLGPHHPVHHLQVLGGGAEDIGVEILRYWYFEMLSHLLDQDRSMTGRG